MSFHRISLICFCGIVLFIFIPQAQAQENLGNESENSTACEIPTPTAFEIYRFKNDWIKSGDRHGMALFWDPVDNWCGEPGMYEFQCSINGVLMPELQGQKAAKQKYTKVHFPTNFTSFNSSAECSLRAIGGTTMSSWTNKKVDLSILRPVPYLMTTTYKSYQNGTSKSNAAFLRLATEEVWDYMSPENKRRHAKCSTWPMIQDYNCCYPKAGMVIRPVHTKSILAQGIQFPNADCSSSNQIFDFCLDWIGWNTYEIRECKNDPESYCILPIDGTQPWLLKDEIYKSSNPIYRILCFPFKSRIVWTEKSNDDGYQIYMLDMDGKNHVQLSSREQFCPCSSSLKLTSPSVTFDWRTMHDRIHEHPAITTLTTEGIYQLIPNDIPSLCSCKKLMDVPESLGTFSQFAIDWVHFYWMTENRDIMEFDWKTEETRNITDLFPQKYGQILQLQSCNAEMRPYAPKKCYFPDFKFDLNMNELTAGTLQIFLQWNNSSDECQQISKPPTTLKVFHEVSDYIGNCHTSNALHSECPLSYFLRNRLDNPIFGIGNLQPNQTYKVEVWITPYHHYKTDGGNIIYPYGSSPYNKDNPYGWLSKSRDVDTHYDPPPTVPAEVFVVSVLGLLALILLAIVIVYFAYKYKWRRLKDIPRIRTSDLKPIGKLGAGHFGDVKEEKYKNKRVATKYLKESAGDYEERCFMEEIRILWYSQGSHIVTMLGICVARRPYRYVMELVNGPSLEEFLRGKRNKDLTLEEIKFCYKAATDINQACIHLESLKVIHRDLAVRNCLVSMDKNEHPVEAKLTDFGLAKELDDARGMYEIPESALNQRELPTALLAPESCLMGTFDVNTEIWAFGVLLWEIFSLGKLPYAGMRHNDIQQHIRAGYRLEHPRIALPETYEIMKKCWNFQPEERPRFKKILESLMSLIGNRKQSLMSFHKISSSSEAPLLVESASSSARSQESQASSGYGSLGGGKRVTTAYSDDSVCLNKNSYSKKDSETTFSPQNTVIEEETTLNDTEIRPIEVTTLKCENPDDGYIVQVPCDIKPPPSQMSIA